MAIFAPAASAPVVLTTERRWLQAYRWLSVLAFAAVVSGLLLETFARALLPAGAIDESLLAVAMLGFALSAAAAVVAWLTHRDRTGLLLLATLAPVVAALRIVGSQLLVLLELRTLADWLDGALALVLVGLLLTALLAAWRPNVVTYATAADEFYQRVVEVTTGVVFVASLYGLGARAEGGDTLELPHRMTAYAATALVAWLAVEALRTQRGIVRWLALALAGSTAAQGGLGVLGSSLEAARPLHAVGALAMWSVAVALAGRTHVAWPALALPSRKLVSAYVQLTKPKVMSLLLATTASAMVIAARGMPPLELLVATLVGGALMAGGAGAINHYVDRDIDPLMGRTAWRPIPSGVISPRNALVFGIVLAVLATVELLLFVNPLATLLSLLGLLGYVFIYTLWLKRSTPSNIVIGGAAGAIPPLVGWAAVTNEVTSLTAWYLFAIIFFWTPPHFWALSLLIRQHYERARVPMLPVVRGDVETRRQILLYSLQLVALTLLLSPFGLMGLPYFFTALVLGGALVGFAVRLWRVGTRPAARSLYLYSMLYLFLLFAGMALDRSLGGS